MEGALKRNTSLLGCAIWQESAQVSDPIQIDLLCDEAIDVAGFMKDHVVQAELNERGNYGENLESYLYFC